MHWTVTQAPTAPPSASPCSAMYGTVQGTVHMQVGSKLCTWPLLVKSLREQYACHAMPRVDGVG